MRFKKVIAGFLAAGMIVQNAYATELVPIWDSFVVKASAAEGGIAVDENNFPDAIFRKYIADNIDDGDGTLSSDEIADVTSIGVTFKGIKDLKGIEFFTNLTALYCYHNELTTLDISKNTALEYLDCSANQLTTLDISKNTALEYLDCSANQLKTLDVRQNTALTGLYCYSNQLTTLDVSKSAALTILGCGHNQLAKLDISNNTALKILRCNNNQITTLDVSKNTALKNLSCDNNQLTTLDVSQNTALVDLECFNNQLTTLDVSKSTALRQLECYNNQLTTLDVSKNTALMKLRCDNNLLTTLDVSKSTALIELRCDYNLLTEIDLSQNTALTDLICSYNQLATLDVSKNTSLKELWCQNNQLTTLDVSKNTALLVLHCGRNQIAKLDISKNITLDCIDCDGNLLTSLDVSQNTALTYLYCYDNQLTTLDLRNNSLLEFLNLDLDITIFGIKGSHVETYANRYNIHFVSNETANAVPYVYKYDNKPIVINVMNNSVSDSGIITEGSFDITPSWVVRGHTTVAEFKENYSAIDASSVVFKTCSNEDIDLSDFVPRIFIQTGSSTYEWDGWFQVYKNEAELSEFGDMNDDHVIQAVGFMVHLEEEERVKYGLKVGDTLYINPDSSSKPYYKIDLSEGPAFALPKVDDKYSTRISAVYDCGYSFGTLGEFADEWSGMKLVGTDGISLTTEDIDINSLTSAFILTLSDSAGNEYYLYNWGKSIPLDDVTITDSKGNALSDKAVRALKIADVNIEIFIPADSELSLDPIYMFTKATPAAYFDDTIIWGVVPGADSYIIETADKELTFKAPIEGFAPEDLFISEGMESGEYSINLYSVTDGKKSKIETFTYTYTAESVEPAEPAVSGTITVSGDTEAVAGTEMSIKNADGTDCDAKIEIAEDGTFTVTGTLPDGDYTITASKSKCCPRDYTVTIEDGQMTGELNVELQLYGDVDNNGIVTLDDVIDVINYFNKKTSAISSADGDLQDYLIAVSDVDGDGVVKLDDAIEMINYFNKKASAFDKIA